MRSFKRRLIFFLILAGNLKFQLAPTLNLFLSVKQKRAMTLASFWQSSPSFGKMA